MESVEPRAGKCSVKVPGEYGSGSEETGADDSGAGADMGVPLRKSYIWELKLYEDTLRGEGQAVENDVRETLE